MYCSAKLNSVSCSACPTNAKNQCPNVPGYRDMLEAEREFQAAFDALAVAKSNLADAQAEYLAAYHVLDCNTAVQLT